MVLFLLGMLLGMILTLISWRVWLWVDEWLLPARTLEKYNVRKRRVLLTSKDEKNKN